nr:MAG TPA: hypothetical protein [Caudoviricetes sp.]
MQICTIRVISCILYYKMLQFKYRHKAAEDFRPPFY